MGKSNCSEQFRKLINRHKRIGYNPYVLRQTACIIINPTSVDSYASLFNCTIVVGPQTQWRPWHKDFTSGLGLDARSLAWPTVVQLVVFFNSGLQWGIIQEYSFFFCQWSIWFCLFVCLCWGLTSQSTIFQSCWDGATASWVINQYFRGVKRLAQGHNTAEVGFEPQTSRSGVRHSTTEPPCSPIWFCVFADMHWVRKPLCEPNFYVFFVLRIISRPRVKLYS